MFFMPKFKKAMPQAKILKRDDVKNFMTINGISGQQMVELSGVPINSLRRWLQGQTELSAKYEALLLPIVKGEECTQNTKI